MCCKHRKRQSVFRVLNTWTRLLSQFVTRVSSFCLFCLLSTLNLCYCFNLHMHRKWSQHAPRYLISLYLVVLCVLALCFLKAVHVLSNWWFFFFLPSYKMTYMAILKLTYWRSTSDRHTRPLSSHWLMLWNSRSLVRFKSSGNGISGLSNFCTATYFLVK